MITLTVVGVDFVKYPSKSKDFDVNKIVPGTILAADASTVVPTAVTKFEYEDDSPRGRSVYLVTEATAATVAAYEAAYIGPLTDIEDRVTALETFDLDTRTTTLEELLASKYQVVGVLQADWTSADAEETFAIANAVGDILLATCTTSALAAKAVRVDNASVTVTLSGNGALTDDIQIFVLRANPA